MKDNIITLKKTLPRLLIGLDGLSGSGKTTLVETLTDELSQQNHSVTVVHLDDLITERSKRYHTGFPQWHEHYNLQWDVARIAETLFQSWHRGDLELHLDHYDSTTGTVSIKPIHVPPEGILLVEGVFLQRPEWRDFFDYLLYLDCPRDIRFQRVSARGNQDPHDPARLETYKLRYWAAEDHYLATVQPHLHADHVLKSN
ncbi:AAA family ATPase [Tumebacillus sp. ITR2]|uniref:AAA family ATPase n=1 Tax=Tumebacillus amylolyticus TaxID=2801339 RepID=A0ABS1J4G9_9BACL|nr:kinase [Tumebacillus amylolyticus]MBL0385173.1 AAA family ATPase [Tumebacillus amylolyticus]